MHVTGRNRPNSSLTVSCTHCKRHINVPSGVSRADGDQPLLGTRVLQVRCNERIVLKHSLDFWDGNAMLLALLTIPNIPVKSVRFKRHSNKVLCKCIYNSIAAIRICAAVLQIALASYFPASSFFTASLTSLPSTRAPANLAITFFITVPMSFMVGAPISAMVAFTAATISSSPTALGM